MRKGESLFSEKAPNLGAFFILFLEFKALLVVIGSAETVADFVFFIIRLHCGKALDSTIL